MSLCATGTKLGGADASTLRQRVCPRVACSIATPPRSDNCCDESCLVEVARRECNREGSHGAAGSSNDELGILHHSVENLQRYESIVPSQPCADHYQKTKDKYVAFLDNLGCICKILLSLNIEPCCIIPSHSPARSASPRSSQNVTKHKDVPISCELKVALDLETPNGCSQSCCGTVESPEIAATAGSGKMTINDYPEEICCTSNYSNNTVHVLSERIPQSRGYSNSSDRKHREALLIIDQDTTENTPPEMVCSKKGCCDDTSSDLSHEFRFNPAETDSSSAPGCCSGQSIPAIHINDTKTRSGTTLGDIGALQKSIAIAETDAKGDHRPRILGILSNATNVSTNCCSGESGLCQANTEEKSASVTSERTKETHNAPDNISINGHTHIDIERALHRVEHFIVRVQGMDCTGCEKKLHRSLATLPELSNIKTSLLLAQAEFDIVPSKSINGDSIISTMEKMTGFSCTKITHSGAELELIFEGSPACFQDGWPTGVKKITVLTQNRIQVSYQPRIIGARDMLEDDPFFRRTRLAPPSAPPLIASGRAHLRCTLYLTLFSAILTLPVLILAWGHLPSHRVLYGAISLALATIVQTVIAGPFYTRTINAFVFSRMVDMDLLIVLSSTAAYVYSVIAYGYLAAGKPLSTEEFFETSTLLVTLIMVGRTVSIYARQKAIESITTESLQTPTALLVGEKPQEENEIDARLLQYEDIFKVLPDMSIVTDGVIVSGESEVDESMITGEATLVAKRPGMSVVAGSVNHSGSLLVKVTRLPHENTIKTIGVMVDQAKSSKPKVQELADRVASFFVPVILGVTLLVFVVWIVIGKVTQKQTTAVSAINAMNFAISVLIVSCPCAIGLAVPMVVVVAGGVAARHGLIFQTAETIDLSRMVSHVIFDKTGTLTQGKLRVVQEEYLNAERDELTSIIHGLATNSKHPVSKALAAHLTAQKIQPANVENIDSVAGNGVKASCNGSNIRAGNPYWLGIQDHPTVSKILTMGLTMFCVIIDEQLVAVFGLQDQLRPDALATVIELKRRSIAISIISGDNEAAVQSVATNLDIPSANTRSRCSPEEKQAYIKSLLANTERKRNDESHHSHAKQKIVLFIGDGTNDAPSLAQASIGLHISEGGTNVAQSAADAILMHPSLHGIITLIDLSKAFHRRVVFNFAWSFAYNLAAVLLAAGVFGKARIPPEFAGLGEVVSVVPVVGIAVCLRWWKG